MTLVCFIVALRHLAVNSQQYFSHACDDTKMCWWLKNVWPTVRLPGHKNLVGFFHLESIDTCRGVGSIFRLRGHQKCKPQIEGRSRNLVTKWKYKLEDILKLTPPPLLKRKMCFEYFFLQKPHKVLSAKPGFYNMKRDLIIWTICAFRVLNHHQWSKQSS